MGKATKNKGKRSTKIKVATPANDFGENGPTAARTAHNEFRQVGAKVKGTDGAAVRLVPVIVRLHERKLITDNQFAALAYYRDQAGLADRSPLKSCIDFSPKGGRGPGVAIQSAIRETGRIENDLGSLWAMTRKVCVDDIPVETLAREQVGDFKLRRLSPELARRAVIEAAAMLLLELKFAAGRIVR